MSYAIIRNAKYKKENLAGLYKHKIQITQIKTLIKIIH